MRRAASGFIGQNGGLVVFLMLVQRGLADFVGGLAGHDAARYCFRKIA